MTAPETTRATDERVAREVMKWKRGEPFGNGNGEWTLPDKSKVYWSHTPKFTTEPAADYCALVAVRDMWNYSQRELFWTELESIWQDRRKSRPAGMQHNHPASAMQYRPGDYSRSALLALALARKETPDA